MNKTFCEDCEAKAFHNWKRNAMHLNFPNGNSISTTFDWASYSENHEVRITQKILRMESSTMWDLPSNNVEIKINCPPELLKKIQRKYAEGRDDNPIGYINITQWLEILNLIK
mgnify:CR=1 FL=1